MSTPESRADVATGFWLMSLTTSARSARSRQRARLERDSGETSPPGRRRKDARATPAELGRTPGNLLAAPAEHGEALIGLDTDVADPGALEPLTQLAARAEAPDLAATPAGREGRALAAASLAEERAANEPPAWLQAARQLG